MSTDPRDNRGYEILQGVVAQATVDDDFRRQLLEDPTGVLRDAGLTISDEVEIEIHENTDNRVHFVLPAGPADVEDLDIDEVDIIAIAYHWPV